MPGSDKKNRTEFLDEALVLAHSGVVSLLPDHVSVHPRFVEDTTPLNEQQIDVEVQQDVNLRRQASRLQRPQLRCLRRCLPEWHRQAFQRVCHHGWRPLLRS